MNIEIIQLLERHNVNPTPMRMLVLEQMLSYRHALSLTEIENLLRPADRVTIYRTLQTFLKQGLAHSIDSGDNKPVFALCEDLCSPDRHNHDHPHFYCEKCGQLFCSSDFSYQLIALENSEHYKIKSIEMKIIGLCPECSKGTIKEDN